jgi:hypothetical protein
MQQRVKCSPALVSTSADLAKKRQISMAMAKKMMLN